MLSKWQFRRLLGSWQIVGIVPEPRFRERIMATEQPEQLPVTFDEEGVAGHSVPVDGGATALLRGWLTEVNGDRLTAQLHDSSGSYVRLRFDAERYDDMRRLATEFVEVRGEGRFNPHDEWTSIHVERVDATRSRREPFDLETVLNDPNPKLFDPEQAITASEPFDVDEFVRVIHEGRDAGREESSE